MALFASAGLHSTVGTPGGASLTQDDNNVQFTALLLISLGNLKHDNNGTISVNARLVNAPSQFYT